MLNDTSGFIPGPISPDTWPVWASLTMAIVLTITGIIAFPLNLIILITFFKEEQLRQAHFFLHINVVCGDFLMVCIDYPMVISSSFARKWLFGEIGCQIYGFIGFFYGMNNIVALAVISFDRYLAVCVHTSGLRINTRTKGFISLIITWTYSLLWCVAPFCGWSSYNYEPYGTSCTSNYYSQEIGDVTYNIFSAIGCLGITIPVMLFSYIKIASITKKSATAVRRHNARLNGRRATTNLVMRKLENQELRVAAMSAALILTFFIAWGPYALIAFLAMSGALQPISSLSMTLTGVPVVTAKLSAIANPCAYIFSHDKIRRAVWATLHCISVHEEQIQTITMTTRHTKSVMKHRVAPESIN